MAGGGEADRRDLLLAVAAGLAPQHPGSPGATPEEDALGDSGASGGGLPPLWAVLGSSEPGLAERLEAAGPAGARAVGAARAGDALAAFHAELLAREGAEAADPPPARVLALLGLERIRGLEPEEETFSMPSFDDNDDPGEEEAAAVSPAAALAALAERGAAVGLHLLAFADGAASLEAVLGRGGLRGFHHRVLFQLSSNDSAALTDATDAAGLGPRRGLLFREDRATSTPFRPLWGGGLKPRSGGGRGGWVGAFPHA